MHKFIIVGHPQSGYQEVENLLHECGMGKAKPSRREGLLPDQISEMLRQAHGTPALAAINAAEQIEQIGTAPVWHGMAMDLMLGNLDQRFWGWSDPGAIHLLEYWKQLDPTINFVFVYADPQSALVGPGADDEVSVDAKLANWQAFNAAMLHFYNRNPKRSVLVQAEQVRHSVRTYLQQLRTQLNAPLEEPPAHLLPGDEASAPEIDAPTASVPGAGQVAAQPGALALGPVDESLAESPDESVLMRFIAGHCASLYPQVVQIYDELQAVANLPLERETSVPSADAAWAALQRGATRAERREQALITTERQNGELAAELDRLRAEIADHADAREDNDLLLLQLHQVQEELEKQFLTCQDSERSLSASEARIKDLNLELDGLRAQQAKHAETSEENELLLLQLHQVQEELERLFLSAQSREKVVEELRGELARHAEATKEKEQLLARLHKAQEALEAAYFGRKPLPTAQARKEAKLLGAAERVKQQLTYRLGATMIENSRSLGGWITMPFALLGTARKFRADVRARGETKLPPISRYHDRHEAARLQQHLSYRLGATLLRNLKSPVGWVRLPFEVRREVKAFRAERKSGKQR